MTRPRHVFALVFLALAIQTGCGSGPRLASVSGTVTLNGKPLEGAVVQFFPDASNKEGLPAEDKTGPEGNYKIMTNGRSGVVPGKYRVMVSKAPEASAAIAGQFQDDPFMAQLSSTPEGPARGKAAKDAKSMKIEQEFERDVAPEGGTIDFDVKATAKAEAATK